jgi:hypothetical protein
MSTLLKEPNFTVHQNPDKDTFKIISEAIQKNNNYCCCAIERTADTMCVCKAFRENEESGFCHCGRFYKVKDYPVITIIHALEDEEHALDLAYGLSTEGFIVILPFYHDVLYYTHNQDKYRDLQKAKIHKADLVFVINSSESAMRFLEEEIYWAEELQKKILYEHNEEVKENEN